MSPEPVGPGGIYPFRVTSVWGRHRDAAQRAAVLFPLLDLRRQSRALGRLTEALVKVRRAKLFALRSRGCERALAGGLRMINCPPFSVSTTPKAAHNCRWYRWCPFCWAREITGDVYERLSWPFFRVGGRVERWSPDAALRHDVVTGTRTYRLPLGADLRAECAELSAALPSFRLDLPVVGGFALAVVEPYTDHYAVSQRFAAVVAAGTRLPLIRGLDRGQFVLRRYERVTRALLADAAAAVCRYPTQMFHGTPESIMQVLSAMDGYRLNARYGALRGAYPATERDDE